MNEREHAARAARSAQREVEALANEVAVRAKAFGGDVGARPRIELVKQRLKIALDELAAYPDTVDDITDE